MKLLWATRGYRWGFRFIQDDGEGDPLPRFEAAFARVPASGPALEKSVDQVAVRFTDPEGRLDFAGRPIMHEIVVWDLAGNVPATAEEAKSFIWPLMASRYAEYWDGPQGNAE